MSRKHIILVALTQLVICALIGQSHALDPSTHQQINAYVSRRTLDSFSFDSYLKHSLGIHGGVGTLVQGVLDNKSKSFQVWQWFGEGGVREDNSWTRSANHFHNPLTDEGFSGIWGLGYKSGESSVLWSQKSSESQDPGGHYSWHDVREYFYQALIVESRGGAVV